MKRLVLLTLIPFLIPVMAMAEEEVDDYETVPTRFGSFELRPEPNNPFGWTNELYLGQQLVHRFDNGSIRPKKVLQGKDKDFAVFLLSSGAKVCPEELLLVEVTASPKTLVSEPFGCLGDSAEVKLEGDQVLIEMPEYSPNPQHFPEEESEEEEPTGIETYIWKDGKLTGSTTVPTPSGSPPTAPASQRTSPSGQGSPR